MRHFLLLPIILAICVVTNIVSESRATVSLSKLQADGKYIRNKTGNTVTLKGFNIEMHGWAYGVWCTYNGSKWSVSDESVMVDDVRSMNPWLLQSEDLRKIQQWGANLVRLQLPHYMFEPISSPGSYYDWGFDQLNAWITDAATRGLYVIIDLHVPYGGRQYNCEDTACNEGKTLWWNEAEKVYTRNLWEEITRRTKHHKNIVYQLMNEPYPTNAGYDNSAWWALAQQLINIIRAQGSDHLIVISNPLPNSTPFVKLADTNNNLAYDFHFYEPNKFTHQQAHWINPTYPNASYPYNDQIEFIGHSYDLNDPDYTSSTNWVRWEEHFDDTEQLSHQFNNISFNQATHIRPTYGSWNCSKTLSFDNAELYVDGTSYNLNNSNFESGTGDFPVYWTQWGNNSGSSFKATWAQEITGNKYIEIPPTGGQTQNRVVMPEESQLIRLPSSYNQISVASKVRGIYQRYDGQIGANLFGLDWFKQTVYDKSKMKEDLTQFILFRKNNNVPVMCLEFGVIMEAEESEGHLQWLDDYTSLLSQHNIHGAYHVYRGLNNEHKSFGIYQCWGKPAVECPENRQHLFVVPTLDRWLDKRSLHSLTPINFLLLFE